MLVNCIAIKSTTGIKFYGTFIILNCTGNCDSIANADFISACALHSIALNEICFISTVNLDCYLNVIILCAVSRVYNYDYTCKSLLVRERFALCKGVSCINYLCGSSICRENELSDSLCLCVCIVASTCVLHCTCVAVCSSLCYFAFVPNVIKSVNFVICVCVVTNRTSMSCITLCCTSRIGYNLVIVVTESVHGNCCSGNLNFTNCTINCTLIRACYCTSRINIVFNYSLTVGVTESVNVCINIGVAASTSVSGVTLLCTSRIGYGRCVAMNVLDRRNNSFLNLAASTTNAVLCTICLFGSGSVFNPFAPCVTESINCCCLSGKFLFANCTVNYCIVRACSCAVRLNVFFNYSLTIGVAESVNCLLRNENSVTNRAVLTFSKTCALASSINRGINNLCVTAKLAIGLAALVANCLFKTGSLAAFVFALGLGSAKSEYDGVNHCSVSTGNSKRNCFCGRCVNSDFVINTIIRFA